MAAGLRAARARLRPRLPARRRRAQDVQVARQRARPVRGHRPLRRRRAALLPACATSRSARTARVSMDGVRARATRPSWPTSSATSPAARSRWSQRYRDGAVPAGRARPGARRRLRRPAPERRRARWTRSSSRDALERDLAARAAAEPLRRGAGAVGARQGRRARRRPRPRARLARRGPARRRGPAARRGCPRRMGDAARRARRPRTRTLARASARARRCSGRRSSTPLFPDRARRRVIDSHTHLDELRARRRRARRGRPTRAGVRRMLTVGMDGASCRAALAAAEGFPQVYAAIGRHPNDGDRLRRRRPRRARGARRARALRRDRRDRPGLLPRPRAAAPTSSARSTRRSSSRARPASRSSSTRAPPRTTRSPRCASTPTASP